MRAFIVCTGLALSLILVFHSKTDESAMTNLASSAQLKKNTVAKTKESVAGTKKTVKAEQKRMIASASQEQQVELFKEPKKYAALDKAKPHVMRQRLVEVNYDHFKKVISALPRSKSDLQKIAASERLLPLNLFADVKLDAVVNSVADSKGSGYVVRGTINGIEGSEFNMVQENGLIVANISLPNKVYEITTSRQGQIVLELDNSKQKPDDPEEHSTAWKHINSHSHSHEETAEGDKKSNKASDSSSQAAGDSSTATVIDILVAYTPGLASAKGGVNAMSAISQLAVDKANAAYENSLIDQRLRLVGIYALETNENRDALNDLNALTSTNGGRWDGVHAERTRLGADLVVGLVQVMDGWCGYAWINSNKSNAFGLVEESCISNHTFTHEVGHNMGAQHDYDTGGTAPYAHGRGYVDRAHNFHTIMGKGTSNRISYFSSPNTELRYNGHPIGVANKSDNARVLSSRKNTMAKLMATKVAGPTPPPVTPPPVEPPPVVNPPPVTPPPVVNPPPTTPPPVEPPLSGACTVTIKSPNSGSFKYKKSVRWSWSVTVPDKKKDKVNLYLMKDGKAVHQLASTGSNNRWGYIKVPKSVPEGDGYTLRIQSDSYANCSNESSGSFKVSK